MCTPALTQLIQNNYLGIQHQHLQSVRNYGFQFHYWDSLVFCLQCQCTAHCLEEWLQFPDQSKHEAGQLHLWRGEGGIIILSIHNGNVLALMSFAYSDGSHNTVFAARIYHLLCSVHMHATADVGLVYN